jgi:tetratricopeptide (TPR) repeat protein
MADHLGICGRCNEVFAEFEGEGRDLVDALRVTATAPTPPGSVAEPDGPGATTLGRFLIREWLAAGGLGAVYRAFDPERGHDVALKLLLPHAAFDGRWRRRFLNEGELARLDHPHVIRVFEAGRAEGIDYLAMEYCAGPSLARWLATREGPVPVRLAARIIAEAAQGAAFCHERGVVHRDISPSNVLLFPRDPSSADDQAFGYTIKLSDFGLAKGLPRAEAREGADTLTATGAILGKLQYLAPEILRDGCKDVDPRADVFSLGVLLYELLVGQSPFRGLNNAQTLRNLENQEPPPPRGRRPEVARDMETICLKCLRKEPGRRYASAEALADDLRCWLDGRPITARPISPPEKLWSACRRRPVVAVLAAILAFVLATGLLTVLLLWWQAEAERRRAEDESRFAGRLLGEISALGQPGSPQLVVLPRDDVTAALRRMRDQIVPPRTGRPGDAATCQQLAQLDLTLATHLELQGKTDECRSALVDCLENLHRVLQLRPGDRTASLRRFYAYQVLGSVAEREGKAEESLAHLERAVACGQDCVRLQADVFLIHQLAECRWSLAQALSRRGDRERARSLILANLRMLDEVAGGAGDPVITVWRTLARLDLHPFRAASSAAPAPRPDTCDPLARLAAPEADALDAESWAELVGRCLTPGPDAVDLPDKELFLFIDYLEMRVAWQRRSGRIDEARRAAGRMHAFARLLAARSPGRSAAHLALCESYKQMAKNAWQPVADRAAIERNWRLAIDEARQALGLDPQDARAGSELADLQKRLDRFLASGPVRPGGGPKRGHP